MNNNSTVRELLQKESYNFDDLRLIMEILRSENGCPWDKEQTHQSIRNDFLEEAYEAIEGIDKGDDDILKEELGDVLLQVVFHSRIAEEQGVFDVDDVADGICKKLILRHPHIFADVTAETSAEVLKNWDEIKKTEKHQNSVTDTLKSVSAAMPSLTRAKKLQGKAAKVGFTYANEHEAMEKVKEEYSEFCETLSAQDVSRREEEFGDLLFALVNTARLCGIDAEQALYKTNEKFIKRFGCMEQLVEADGRKFCELNVKYLTDYWKKTKN